MASGTISTAVQAAMPGLASRTVNYAGQMFAFPTDTHRMCHVGHVTRERTIRVMLWNGSSADAVLTAIGTNGDQADGIEWSDSPPYQVDANVSRFSGIIITPDGPLEFTAVLTFVASCSLDQTLTILGTRASRVSGNVGYLFFPHNWADGLDETLAWKTDVLIAHDRTEQRVQLRTMPRRQWQWRFLVSGVGRGKLETWLGLRKTRQLCTPVWRDMGRATAKIPSGSLMIPVDTSYLDYAVGRPVAVFDAWDNFELRTVSGIGPGFVAVDAPFNREWPQGSLVAPCRFGICLQQRAVARFTEDVAEYQVAFDALGESLMPSIVTPDTYRSIRVCPQVPSWASPETTLDNKWVRLDNDTGLLEYDIQSIEPVIARETTFLVIGRARIDEMLRFLFALAGRLAAFWLATDDRAFELAAPAAQDATVLVIHPIDYEFALSGSPAREHIEMITTDGTVIRRKIIAVVTMPSGLEQWTIDSGLPVAIDAATLNRCAWLELVRLESDTVDLHWVAWDCVELTLPVVALP